MDLFELNALTLEGAPTVSIPVPRELSKDLVAHLEDYGLPPGTSLRQAHALLILEGAQATQRTRLDAACDASHAGLVDDVEWREARASRQREAERDRRF